MGQHEFLRMLLSALQVQPKYIPILADDNFRFPSPEFVEENRPIMEAVGDLDTMESLIKKVFKTIAVVFSPSNYSSTKQVLMTVIDQIISRLEGKELQRLSIAEELPKVIQRKS